MRVNRMILVGAAVIGLAACGQAGAPEPTQADANLADPAPAPDRADMIVIAAAVHTGVAEEEPAEALAIEDGRFAYIGDEDGARALAGEETVVIDLGDGAVFPGFVDSHAHLLGVGLRETSLNLETAASVADMIAQVAKAAESDADVILGRGWIETHWPEDRVPNRDDLDAVVNDRPVVLERGDGHAVVVNTAALVRVGIDDSTPDPAGGRIERDADGRPTGLLVDHAMAFVQPLMAEPVGAAREAALIKGAEVYAAHGWTGLHNVSLPLSDAKTLERLSDQGRIKIRVYNAIDAGEIDALIAAGPSASANGRVVTRAVKAYMDGALGSRGALLAEPYADAPDRSGLSLLSEADAAILFDKAATAGVQVLIHAIGDKANTLALDWMAAAFARHPDLVDPRWRIEHAQVVDRKDWRRFGQLGVIASMQPSHAIGDLHFAPLRLGEPRLGGAYAWRGLTDAGARLTFGSDAPVERGDPLIEFYAAIARTDLKGFQGPDWRPDQALSRIETVALLSAAPAFASFQEGDIGLIAVGRKADLSAFSGDVMMTPARELQTLKAVLTVVDGEIAYRAKAEDETR